MDERSADDRRRSKRVKSIWLSVGKLKRSRQHNPPVTGQTPKRANASARLEAENYVILCSLIEHKLPSEWAWDIQKYADLHNFDLGQVESKIIVPLTRKRISIQNIRSQLADHEGKNRKSRTFRSSVPIAVIIAGSILLVVGIGAIILLWR